MPSVPAAARVPVDRRPGVAVRLELGQRDLRHGGGGGQRAAADGAETRAGAGRCHRQSAFQWPMKAAAKRNSERDRPPWVANWPISMNSGITARS